ncbi:MAG TPA: hypothetical protein PKC24_05470 [Cyclobacteriaceae bacterium]|nr:hypothetical protein [Cyclobacteriaceae bacterium]
MTSFVAVAQHQAHEIGFAYNFMKPYENMQEHIQRGHGFSLDYYFHPKNKRFAAGLELNYNLYGRDKSRQVYTFPDNSTGEADIVVYNNFSTLMLGGRYYLGKSGTFQPFINAKLGYAWLSTELNIYDPADWDQCEPLDREVLLRDGTPSSAFGAGFQIDLDKKRPNTFMLQMQSNMLLGNHVKYMSVRAPVNQAPHQQHNQPDEVRARFINNQTQIVHEHHVGNVYSNLLRTLDFRLGFSYRFN